MILVQNSYSAAPSCPQPPFSFQLFLSCSICLLQATASAEANKQHQPQPQTYMAMAAALKRLTPAAAGRPTPQECKAVIEALATLHGRPNRHQHSAGLQPGCELKEPHSVLDSLVRTILSQNTTDVTSARAYTSLKQSFPSWELVRTAAPGAVEDAIRVGGLADIKASRIKAILDSLLVERGQLSLEHLRELPCEDIKAQLGRYKGVGPKSIACVMLFCLGRNECPVDTHVWEISKQLGWVPETASREATYEYLNMVVPDEHKYELHVLLVEHGKVCPQCFKRKAGQSGAKRKGKGAGAAAAACPLAPFKRGSKGAVAAAAAAVGVAVKASSSDDAAGTATVVVKAEPPSPQIATGAAVAVKVEQLQDAVKVEQLQDGVCGPVAVKQEPGDEQLLPGASVECAAAQQQPARTRKRSRRG